MRHESPMRAKAIAAHPLRTLHAPAQSL